jgi:hypothetical protein
MFCVDLVNVCTDTYKIKDGYLQKNAKNFTVLIKNQWETEDFTTTLADPFEIC